MRAAWAAIGALCAATSALGAEGQHQWVAATVLDVGKDIHRTYLLNGTSGSGHVSGTATPIDQPVWTYVFGTDEYVYVASHQLKFRWNKPCRVTVNRSVQIAAEGEKLYVLDEDEKEHKLTIDKRVRRPSTPPPEAGRAPAPSPAVGADSNAPATDAKKISVGMSTSQVEGALGKPSQIVVFGDRTRWTYPDGLIVVFEHDLVSDVKF